jgi:predicted transcriptional regulator
VQRPLPLPRTTSLEEVVRRTEMDPRKAQLLEEARRALGTVYDEGLVTLSGLRLKAGLSQSMLAERAQMSQPHIARIERGNTDPGTETVARIARALGVAEKVAFEAIRNQLSTRAEAK